mgnify:CR=1 FL=1
MRLRRLASAYAIGVGLAMLGMWTAFYLAGEISDLTTAPLEIGFHLLAEGLTAIALLAAGVGLLRDWGAAVRLLPVALGMLLYTVVNSAGYYAPLGEWPMVGMFLALTALTLVLVLAILRGWMDLPEGQDGEANRRVTRRA